MKAYQSAWYDAFMEHGAESFHVPERGSAGPILKRVAEVPETFDAEASECIDLLTGEDVRVHAEDVREIVEEGGALYAVNSGGEAAAYFVIEKNGAHAEILYALGRPSFELSPEHFEEFCRALAERGFESVSTHVAPNAAGTFGEMMRAKGEEDGFVRLTRDL